MGFLEAFASVVGGTKVEKTWPGLEASRCGSWLNWGYGYDEQYVESMGVSESGYGVLRRAPKPDVELAWIVWNRALLCVAAHTVDHGGGSRATAVRPSTPDADGPREGSWRRRLREVHESCPGGFYASDAPYGFLVHAY